MSENEKIIDNLDILVKLAGLAGSASIIVSIIYDWGFYHALGFSLSQVPTTLSDHARSSLEWFPYISTTIFAVIVWDLVMSRIERGKTEEELIQTSPFPRITAFIRISPYIAMAFFLMTVFVNYVFLKKGSIWDMEVRLAMIIFWFLLSGWIYSEKRIKDRTPKLLRKLFHWGPPAIFVIASIGYSNASQISDLNNTQIIWSTDSKGRFEATILRTFEKGLMIKENEKQNIIILPWTSVKKIETAKKYARTNDQTRK